MQLDIFEHSRDLMLRNDALHALQRRDAAATRRAAALLSSEYPHDAALPDLSRLVDALEPPSVAAFADFAAAARALRQLQDELAPAAQRLLGSVDGHAWSQPLWQQLARRAEALEFRAEHADCHAAALWLRAGDAAAAAAAVERIASWRRIPAPLDWMCQARWRLQGLDASFEAKGDASPLAWFPAWVLTEKPALALLLGQAQPGLQTDAERALRLLLDLLHLERPGRQRELVDQRRRLRDLQPALFRAYMATR